MKLIYLPLEDIIKAIDFVLNFYYPLKTATFETRVYDLTMKNVALVVFACDRYELLYKGFDFFFSKYWDSTIELKKYFTTEEKDLDLDGYIHLKSGKGPWSNRLKTVLDQIEEEYVILLQEDMWFSRKVPEGVLEPLLDYVLKNRLKFVKLHSAEFYRTQATGHNFGGMELSLLDNHESKYLMSHQVSLWKKDFLYSQMLDNEHPWRNEKKGTKRLKKGKDKIYQIDLIGENEKAPINNNTADVQPGAYLTISVNACIHPKVEKILPELETSLPDYADKISWHLKNQITHDGLEKPRKEDFFKKLKRRFKEIF